MKNLMKSVVIATTIATLSLGVNASTTLESALERFVSSEVSIDGTIGYGEFSKKKLFFKTNTGVEYIVILDAGRKVRKEVKRKGCTMGVFDENTSCKATGMAEIVMDRSKVTLAIFELTLTEK